MLDYISNKIEQNPDLILHSDPSMVGTFVIGVGMTDYRPKNWDILKDYIEQSSLFTSTNVKDIIWLKMIAVLCSLDIYKSGMLQTRLSGDFLTAVLQRSTTVNKLRYFSLTLTFNCRVQTGY